LIPESARSERAGGGWAEKQNADRSKHFHALLPGVTAFVTKSDPHETAASSSGSAVSPLRSAVSSRASVKIERSPVSSLARHRTSAQNSHSSFCSDATLSRPLAHSQRVSVVVVFNFVSRSVSHTRHLAASSLSQNKVRTRFLFETVSDV
jgi:hypothetical protein